MTWLVAENWESKPMGERFQALLDRPGIVKAPGAHNAMAGLLAKAAGFDCLYVSGAAVTAAMALPDLGVIQLNELCDTVRQIHRATQLPLIVDGDTGYGEVLNVMRTIRELEDAGAAAIQMEDQILPKKCGHLNDKLLASPEEMARKVAAARKARRHLRIIARTDAVQSEGLEAGLARARLYAEAGADLVFADGIKTPEEFRRFSSECGVPFMANMTEFGRTPYYTAQQFQEFGCKVVIWPVSSLRVAAKAMESMYSELAEKGTLIDKLEEMQTRAQLYDTIGYHSFEELDDSVAATVVPDDIRTAGPRNT
ncbi:MAG: methylisocitrate lyase [Alphaproteobacteria bacterium]|jgi:methylisocitrate lyase